MCQCIDWYASPFLWPSDPHKTTNKRSASWISLLNPLTLVLFTTRLPFLDCGVLCKFQSCYTTPTLQSQECSTLLKKFMNNTSKKHITLWISSLVLIKAQIWIVFLKYEKVPYIGFLTSITVTRALTNKRPQSPCDMDVTTWNRNLKQLNKF